MGEYQTQERAKEVLKEIADHIDKYATIRVFTMPEV